jgi:AcrR family transcriptional regulator
LAEEAKQVPRTSFRTTKSRETFEAILATSVALFSKKGFAKTSLRAIAKKRGMSLGALYYYFRSKEEIVVAFYEDLNARLAHEFLPRIAGAPDLPAAFEAYVLEKLARLAPARRFLHVIAREALDPTSPLSPFSQASRGALDAALGIFEEMAERLMPPRAVAPRGAARILWLAHLAILLFWLQDGSEGEAATRRLVATAATALRWWAVAREVPGAEWIEGELAAALSALGARTAP